MTDRAKILGPAVLDEIRDIVQEHDPDPIVIAVLTGSPARKLALSVWTAMEGPDAELRSLELLQYAMEADAL